jgi:predicted alpha/beta superfamily hydrolase
MEKTELSAGGCSISIFTPALCTSCPAAYVHIGGKDARALAALQDDAKLILIAVDGVDWENSLSPWPAPRAFRGGKDFAGGADRYLKVLTGDIVPAVEASLGFTPPSRYIAGYSMAGLFAIYALYRTDLFSRAASVSGSLWYDGFLDFMEQNRPLGRVEKVYFSLGDRESKTKNRRLASVEARTVRARNLIQSLGTDALFEWNPGGHFMDIPERISKGLGWII